MVSKECALAGSKETKSRKSRVDIHTVAARKMHTATR